VTWTRPAIHQEQVAFTPPASSSTPVISTAMPCTASAALRFCARASVLIAATSAAAAPTTSNSTFSSTSAANRRAGICPAPGVPRRRARRLGTVLRIVTSDAGLSKLRAMPAAKPANAASGSARSASRLAAVIVRVTDPASFAFSSYA